MLCCVVLCCVVVAVVVVAVVATAMLVRLAAQVLLPLPVQPPEMR